MERLAAISLIPGAGMIIVSALAVVYWRGKSRIRFRWFWVGAALWTVAVALKVLCALLTHERVVGFLGVHLSGPLFVMGGGLYMGIESSFFEIGLTIIAVLIWRQLGSDAERAIAIGLGAGAFEAFLLGAMSMIAMLALLAGIPGTEHLGGQIKATAAVTPVFWLIGPAERIIAILCHTSSRALVLLGITHGRPVMVISGFLLFTLLDGIAGAAHLSGKLGQISMWWIELSILPCALVSIPILRWCSSGWGRDTGENTTITGARRDNG